MSCTRARQREEEERWEEQRRAEWRKEEWRKVGERGRKGGEDGVLTNLLISFSHEVK